MRPGTLAKAMTVFDAEDDLDISALEKACKQAARPSQDLADWTMLALREEDRVEVICAPFEADAQVAAEATRRREMKPGRRVVVLASSLDGDIPLYPGVGEVVFWRPGTSEKKAQIVTVGANPPARLKVAKGRTYDFSGWSWGAFILLLIAGGCDYVGNLNNVGIPTLYDTLQPYMRANHFSASACRPYDLLMLLVRTHKAPEEWALRVRSAWMSFHHHPVFRWRQYPGETARGAGEYFLDTLMPLAAPSTVSAWGEECDPARHLRIPADHHGAGAYSRRVSPMPHACALSGTEASRVSSSGSQTHDLPMAPHCRPNPVIHHAVAHTRPRSRGTRNASASGSPHGACAKGWQARRHSW